MGKRLYGVFDAASGLIGVANTEPEALSYARSLTGSVYGDPTLLQGTPTPPVKLSNPPNRAPFAAYERTALPARCKYLYGQDHLTPDLVYSFSVAEAYSRIRPYLPNAFKWQGKPGEEARVDRDPTFLDAFSEGFLAKNAKLEAGEVLGNVDAVCMGVSFAPHSLGLRPVGAWTGKSYTNTSDPLRFPGLADPESDDLGTEPAPRLYTNSVLRNLASDKGGRNGKWLDEHLPTADGSLPWIEGSTPSKAIRAGKYTLCAYATNGDFGCRKACLAFSGQNSSARQPMMSKLSFTRALLAYPAEFMRVLQWNIQRYFRLAASTRNKKKDFYIRLNVYSDVPWELFYPALMDPILRVAHIDERQTKEALPPGAWKKLPRVGRGSYYDYTKVPGRVEHAMVPYLMKTHSLTASAARKAANDFYWLTFSYSGSNVREAKKAVGEGRTVAMVFAIVAGSPLRTSADIRYTLEAGGKSRGATRVKKERYKELVASFGKKRIKYQYAPKKFKTGTPKSFPATIKVLPEPFYRFKYSFPGDDKEYLVINGDANDVRGYDHKIMADYPSARIVGLDYKIPRIATGAALVRAAKKGQKKGGDLLIAFYDENVEDPIPGSVLASDWARENEAYDEDGDLITGAGDAALFFVEQYTLSTGKEARIEGKNETLQEYDPKSVFVTPLTEISPGIYAMAVVPSQTSQDSGPDSE